MEQSRAAAGCPCPAKIAVVIPAYRTECQIEKVVRSVPSLVSWIIVVDDCSPDRTAEIVTRIAKEDARIRLVCHETNQGVGGAVLTGYRAAHRLGAGIVVKIDGDGQMDPAQLVPLIRPILCGEADYTKGNRFLHTRQLQRMPLVRRIGNLGLSFLTKMASGYWNIFDPTNGYTALHGSLIPELDDSALGRRYFFESSMLLELSLLRAVVRDVCMPAHYSDEQSSLWVLHTLIEFPAKLFRRFLRRLWIQYFVRDFGVFSVLLVCGSMLSMFGLAFGSYHWVASSQLKTSTPTGTIMLSTLTLILGIQFLLQGVLLDVQSVPARPVHGDLTGDAAYEPIVFPGFASDLQTAHQAANSDSAEHRRVA